MLKLRSGALSTWQKKNIKKLDICKKISLVKADKNWSILPQSPLFKPLACCNDFPSAAVTCVQQDLWWVLGTSPEKKNILFRSSYVQELCLRQYFLMRFVLTNFFFCHVDSQSINGVLVNGVKVPPNKEMRLSLGDSVLFGVKLAGDCEFEYRVVASDLASTEVASLKRSQGSSFDAFSATPPVKRACVDDADSHEVARLRVALARMERRLNLVEGKDSHGPLPTSARKELEAEKKAMEERLREELVAESQRREDELKEELKRQQEAVLHAKEAEEVLRRENEERADEIRLAAQRREEELQRRMEEEIARLREQAELAARHHEEELRTEMEGRREELQKRAQQAEEDRLQQVCLCVRAHACVFVCHRYI